MNTTYVCKTNLKILIGYMKRNNAEVLLSRIAMIDIDNPSLADYLFKKRKSLEKVAAYVGRREVKKICDAALSLLVCLVGISTGDDGICV